MCPAKSYRSDLRSRASQPNCASPSASFCFDEKKDTSNTLQVEKELKDLDESDTKSTVFSGNLQFVWKFSDNFD